LTAMNRLTVLTLAALCSASVMQAQESPLWVRRNAISPDGTQIAFCYKGDIWTVSAEGGRALQITSNEAYDTDPIWTRDGKLVFASYRDGGKDIFITSMAGGTPKRLTDIPGSETPLAVLQDGRVLFSANLGQDPQYGGFPQGDQLYMIGQDGGRAKLVTSLPMEQVSVNSNGDVLYEDWKGYEDDFRKHHTSSVTRDIWLCKGAMSGNDFRISGDCAFRKLSPYVGEDRQPVFAADGRTFYYLSEQDGKTLNIYRSSIDSPDSPVQLTHYTDNPVRYISVSDDGLISYSYNGELWTLREGEEPKKVAIDILSDSYEKDEKQMTISGNITSIAVSPDGNEVAIISRGDVYATSIEYGTTRRITDTPEQERDLSFSEDGRTLYYSSERNGHWGIWRTSLKDKKDKHFTYSNGFEEEQFSDGDETCFQPVVSPDGKMVAFLRDRTELVVKPTKGGVTKSLLKGVNYSYTDGDQSFAWSPDSRFLLTNYQGDGRWNNTDIALIEVESGKLTDLTESGYSDGSFRWALGGKAMTWTSDKNGYRSHGSWGAEDDIYIMFFDPETMVKFKMDKEDDYIASLREDEKKAKKDSTDKDKKPEKLDLKLEGRDDRIIRLTRSSDQYGDHYLTSDGKTLFYITPLESGYGLCKKDIKTGDVSVVKKGVYATLLPTKDDEYLFLVDYNSITRLSVLGGDTKTVSYRGDYTYRPAAERSYIFFHAWKQVKEKFYDETLRGMDWEGYRDNYARFLPYINNDFDFAEMLSEMLGELDGSHTGARYRDGGGASMSYLGVILDPWYEGDGLKIAEVLPDGVLSLADPEIKAGDIIESIDGHEIKAGQTWRKYLADKAGKKIALTVAKGGKKAKELFIEPSRSDSDLLYRRWVSQREKAASEMSGGKVGYVHVEGMDSPSFREVYSKALGKYRNCDALVVDTRHNGGGWLHDDLATFLSGKLYATYEPRGQYIGPEPFNKWFKPSCVLMGEDNYSDASAFPYAYKSLGIGKLIGAPVPGTMTAVWWETQVNPKIIFGIPQVGTMGVKEGRYLEGLQVEPDILVYDDPAATLRGEDVQLKAAVEEMMKNN